MKRAHFRFYAELGDLLPPARQGVTFPYEFRGSPSVKDVVESLGVPHTEVDLILADGESVAFSWTLRDGARVSVFPVFESIDIKALAQVRPVPLRATRFVLDGHLGRLARYLRMLGYDALWQRDACDAEIANVAAAEHRIVLTRDVGLLKRRTVTHGYYVRALEPPRQLAEVIQRLDLARSAAPFSRCLRCNALLEVVSKEGVASALPPLVREREDAFRRCPSCGRIYWAGSHHRRMERLVADALAEGGWARRAEPAASERGAAGVGTVAPARHLGEEAPRRFEFQGRRVEVVRVVGRWVEEGQRCLEIRGDDGIAYLLRYDERGDRWEPEALERKG